MQRIFKNAAASGDCIHIVGVAHAGLFGGHPVLANDFKQALDGGATAKLIFLDPDSPNCARRAFYEAHPHRLDTIRHVRDSIKAAHALDPQKVTLHLTPEVSTWMCFNKAEIVTHSYLNSIEGVETPSQSAPCGSRIYVAMVQHFKNLWGDRKWLLFDLGNVLIDFDHRKFSQRLVQSLQLTEQEEG